MSNPNVCVLKTDGINCDEEMAYAFESAGAVSDTIHINQLRDGDVHLRDYGILAIPGGFSYGDDIASGRVLANELTSYLSDQLSEFISEDKPVIGICNGFQTLVKAGVLPYRTLGEQQITLAENEIGRFDCRWIELSIGQSVCRFAKPENFLDVPIPMQTAHGEGRFFGSNEVILDLKDNKQVVFSYSTRELANPSDFPNNPNGSIDNIAGICDQKGVILGMMPHPERSISSFHPNRNRTESARAGAQVLFNNIIAYSRSL